MEDGYAVLNSEDEMVGDDHSLDECYDNDYTSEALIRSFSPYKDQTIEREIQQVTKNQSLSPRSFQQDRFHFTKQDANTVTAGRPNTSDIDCNILDEDEQQITCDMKHNELQYKFTSTFTYAKCKDRLRRPLWEKLLHHASININPWCAVGDYNVISDVEEKLGGLPYNMKKSMDFIAAIEACGLVDIGFSGHKYTWSNKRGITYRIWKRLDRALVNDLWLEKMPQTTITHLSTTGSDHCPLLLEMVSNESEYIKYFRFLNCWIDNRNFILTVKECWDRPVEGNAMWQFHQKMKRISNTLSVWSRKEFGDIFNKVRMYEEQVHEAEENYILNQSDSNRSTLHELNAQYIKFLKLEDTILKQETQLQWLKDGDNNSKYFHSIIRGRRRKLFIHKIVTENGDWVQGENNIAHEACEHFNTIFTGENKFIDEHNLECIPNMVNQDQNTQLTKLPDMDELKEEIIHQIKKPNIGSNVIIKLDMAKAYDRVSWSYICLVLRKMGFNEMFIDMCWRIMANNWYSIIINGKRYGFFQSTRGLKQGDPLSPALFNLGAEVLSRSLNRLHNHPDYQGFIMEKRGPQVNHLSFADDIILFTSGRCKTLKILMDTLKEYEKISGQLINGDKIHFMLHPSAFNSTRDRIKRLTGFKQKQGPITYLGCPLFVGRPRNVYFSDLINKVVSRIIGWQTKQISFGGKAVLSKHVLQALPIHLLTAVTPPNTIINQIPMLIADFFWGWQNNSKKYHWSSWKNLSYPYEEGGIGMRNLHDVCKSFKFKQWWTFRTKQTLFGDFLKAKYCQRSNPVSKKWDTGESLAWKRMLATRQQVEQHIQWQLQTGNCSFWWDNCLGIGPLTQHTSPNIRLNNTKVADF
ncbi:uncharacterized protein LOC107003747 [Solanum pennellii]|uniref:Uncharacterized protein LOC107003747 n=1 Tax=Solanum pennellii TaxID=28526 RepID=A0ABM1FIY2_SOLPN|nr:uncharacterized protein LOC107003747 [Solanum pennellii]